MQDTTASHPDNSNRERILAAAIEAFGTCGYDGASTNQICAAAGLSKGLLFHYFKSKENLYMAVVKRCLQDFADEFREHQLEDERDLQALAKFYRLQADFFSEHPDYYYILTQIPVNQSEPMKEFMEKCREEFVNAVSLGLRLYLGRVKVRPGVDREVALELLIATVFRLEEHYIVAANHREIPLEELSRQMEQRFLAEVNIISYGILSSRPE